MPSRATVHATFVVDTGSDPSSGTSCAPGHAAGTCSLRAAVAAADADTGHVDAITIPSGTEVELSQEVTLDLTNSMFIDGTGATVNGEGAEVFDQFDSPSVQITGLTITGGFTTGDGGGIYCSNGALVLNGVHVVANTAADGGGVYTASHCQLWVDSSVFSRNVATGSLRAAVNPAAPRVATVSAFGDGGGLYTYGSAFITRTVIGGSTAAAGNLAEEGAGLYNYDGNVVLTNSVVSHNASPSHFGYGVGLYNDEVMDVENTSIDHNSAPLGADGAGMDVEYLTTITNSSFVANTAAGASNTTYGGGLYDDGDTTTLKNVSFVGNNVTPTSGESVYGGAVLSYAYNFSWDGGSILGQTNGVNGQSDYIEGGAIYLDGSHASVRNVTISGTTNRSLPDEYPEGGAIYVNEYTELTNVNIANTTNTGYDVYGGAIYNDDYATMTNLQITGTNNHATDSSGGYIAGGLIYNDGENMAISGLVADKTTNLADTLTSPTESSSEVDGGLVYNDYESTIDGFTATNTSTIAKGGAGEVYGGAFYNDESLILRDSQFLGTTVQADSYVEGGLFYNDDRLSARNFTMGSSGVKVLGGPMAGPAHAYGTVLYNDSQADLLNTTFSDITSAVASSGSFAYGIDNEDLLQVTNSTFANDAISGPPKSKTVAGDGTWFVVADLSSQLSLRNSIVASSTPALNCAINMGVDSNPGVILSTGYNIDNGSSCKFTRTGDMQNTDPMVLPLHDNGGMVLTAALKPPFYGPFVAGSPAIDAGSNFAAPTTDARGVARPQQGRVDIGAYEVEAQGYNMSALDGGLFHFGTGGFKGSVRSQQLAGVIGALQGPIVAMAATPDHGGYWQAGADGGVFTFGTAKFRGSIARLPLATTIVGITPTPDGAGYWLVNSFGHVYPFGDATYFGSEEFKILHERVVGIIATRDGMGYWLATANGHVLAFGDAKTLGSPAASGITLSSPLVGIAATPDHMGYWLVAADGGIFRYGDAKFYGSMGGRPLNKPIVAMASTPDGFGYWMFASDGGLFRFGDAKFLGSMGGISLASPVSAADAAS